jgi:hypothetical protein
MCQVSTAQQDLDALRDHPVVDAEGDTYVVRAACLGRPPGRGGVKGGEGEGPGWRRGGGGLRKGRRGKGGGGEEREERGEKHVAS